MLDLKKIRQCPEDLVRMLEKRGLSQDLAHTFIVLDQSYREAETTLQGLQAQVNSQSKSHPTDPEQAQQLKQDKQKQEKVLQELKKKWEDMHHTLPNFLLPEVPEGKDEKDNVVCHTWGKAERLPWQKDHVQLGQDLDGMDFAQAAKVSGSRFVYLAGDVARLERALGQWFLDSNIKAGFKEIATPYLVRPHAAFGAGQLPKFHEDLFQTTNGFYLISTSEVSLVNWAASRVFTHKDLPLFLTALTPCFRSEAGASGKDTHGMIRQHQFHKAELVIVCWPEQAQEWHEKMVLHAQGLLESLNLPHRKVLLCAGDTGSASQKTYDLEVWLPAQNTYREIASCSQCGTYQSRRLNIKGKNAKGTRLDLATLNGSSLPTGRTLVAILENHQRMDGSIEIPEVLRPYMGGMKILERNKNR